MKFVCYEKLIFFKIRFIIMLYQVIQFLSETFFHIFYISRDVKIKPLINGTPCIHVYIYNRLFIYFIFLGFIFGFIITS